MCYPYTIIRVLMFAFFILAMNSLSLLGMDSDKCDFVFREIIIPHHIDQVILPTLSMVTSVYNTLIENKNKVPIIRIKNWIKENKIVPERVSWDKDFNACAWIGKKDCTLLKPLLELILVGLVDEDVIIKTGQWDNYERAITNENIYPFFNQKGAACFHGCGWLRFNNYGLPCAILHVFEYGLDLLGKKEDYCCMFELEQGGRIPITMNFTSLLGLPILLQAILHSTQVRKLVDQKSQKVIKMYSMKGVTIPDNYKDYTNVYNEQKHYRSFDKFSKSMQNAIIRLYEEQQHKKNKK